MAPLEEKYNKARNDLGHDYLINKFWLCDMYLEALLFICNIWFKKNMIEMAELQR